MESVAMLSMKQAAKPAKAAIAKRRVRLDFGELIEIYIKAR